jgi:hypothetical protein
MGKWVISFSFGKVLQKKEFDNLTAKFEAKQALGFDLNIKETVVTSDEQVFKLDLEKLQKIDDKINIIQQKLSH